MNLSEELNDFLVDKTKRTGEVPSTSVPVFSFSASTWDDRELVRAFQSAVDSYKRRKEPVREQEDDPSKRHRVEAKCDVEVVAPRDDGDDVDADYNEGTPVILTGNVVHVEEATATATLSNQEILSQMLQAHYWAGYWAGKYSNAHL